jgi:hypothetical protein
MRRREAAWAGRENSRKSVGREAARQEPNNSRWSKFKISASRHLAHGPVPSWSAGSWYNKPDRARGEIRT